MSPGRLKAFRSFAEIAVACIGCSLIAAAAAANQTWFDRNGYRVASAADTTDFDAPTIVFTGESIMVGHQLAWAETIAAQTSAMLGLQSANIAVSGFATDQAYLRLATELPRFRHPVAVVSLFAPSIFDRNLDDDRPHLGPGLVWLPPAQHWRLTTIARRLIGYRSEET